MKLALIRQRYTAFGGAERYVDRLAAILAEQGHEVHMLARKWNAGPAGPMIFHPVHSLGGPTFIKQPAFARAVARMVGRGGYDLVHGFDRTWSQDVYRAGDGCHVEFLARRARMEGARRGWIDRINPRHRAFLDLEARLFSDARLKRVLANSKQGRDEIMRHYRVPESKIRVVYNGLDKARFHPGSAAAHREAVRAELGLAMDEPLALFVGSGFVRKGLRELIGALQHCRCRLLVAGRDRREPFVRLADRLGLSGRVLFLGPRTDVDRLYGAADVFVLPSWYEPFSNACLEAMASGLPVVTTEETGAAEVIERGVNGCTVKFPVVSEELGQAVDRALALDRPALIRANQRILRPFDWDENVAQTLAVYEEILGRKLS